jgi:multiple antibiotic resistance protein
MDGAGLQRIGRAVIVPPMLERFIQAFIPLFVAIDPIGMVAIFLALGRGTLPEARRRIARQATLTGGGVALLFLLLGQSIFSALGISVSDFQIAGGLILFILAARDLIHSAAEEPAPLVEGFGVVPLGMPLIAGPATIAALLLLTNTVGMRPTLAALGANLLLLALAFAYSEWLGRKIGPTGLRAISKIISMLLAAIAVNMIRRGIMG